MRIDMERIPQILYLNITRLECKSPSNSVSTCAVDYLNITRLECKLKSNTGLFLRIKSFEYHQIGM